MAKTSIEKRKAKRKAKQKQRKVNLSLALQKSKAEYLFQEALWLRDDGKLEKAIAYLEKALKSDPHNKDMLNEIAYLGNRTAKPDVELKGLLGLHNNGCIKIEHMPALCELLKRTSKYEQSLSIAEETLQLIPKMKIRNKRATRAFLVETQKYCRSQLQRKLNQPAVSFSKDTLSTTQETIKPSAAFKNDAPTEIRSKKSVSVPEIPITIQMDSLSFLKDLVNGESTSLENYELALEGHRIRFKETFDNLICLYNL
ncbi:MAG: hypothetical protein KJ550_11635, partial [Proteobacteria bacterium]|nr:hypothetical protein [Pseudomonadota bacterium]